MPNAWLTALKEWNSGRDMWCMPKKGTAEYNQVRALMPEKAQKASKPAPKEDAEGRAEADRKYEQVKEYFAKLKAAKEAPAAPKAKRTIKVSKKVHEAAAPAPSSGEERMKIVSAALKKQDEELAEKERKKKSMAARKAIEKRVKDRLKNA